MSEKKEYIERGALIKALDEHKASAEWDVLKIHTDSITAIIVQQPAADVEPVVRCNKCKHGTCPDKTGFVLCAFTGFPNEDNFFCAHGKER